MADFVPATITKSAVRNLHDPHTTISSFNTLISTIVGTNPWGCIAYTQGGAAMPPVAITKQIYSGKINYENASGKVIGSIAVNAPTVTGFTNATDSLAADVEYEGFLDGTAIRKPLEDRFSVTLRCCHVDGDVYNVTFTRDKVRVSGYSNDAILTTLETWADGVAALA